MEPTQDHTGPARRDAMDLVRLYLVSSRHNPREVQL